MGRWFSALLLAAALLYAQDPKEQQNSPKQGELKRERPRPAKPKSDQIETPPEEDESVAPTQYSFNPLQSQKDVSVGNQYWKKGNYHAAAMRYREATKWNDSNSDAWLKLAEAAQKSKDSQAAKEAYSKYLTLEPDAKNAPEIRKRLAKLK